MEKKTMSTASLRTLGRHLRRVVGPPNARGVTDAQLLERFATQRDEAAFELLVWRHQRLVLGVCRRVLRNPHDAEDAFQATFLTLVRKAGSIGKREAVASWLYQVAYRIALRAQAGAAKRAAREKLGLDLSQAEAPADPQADGLGGDLWRLLEREISCLPEKYRAPVVLCYLEGKTYEEAARELGCPKGTVSTWLTHAREWLRSRLARDGLALSGGVLATVLCRHAAVAAAPAALVDTTVEAAVLYAAGAGPVAGIISDQVVALTKGALRAMGMTKLKIAMMQVAVCLFGLGTGWTAFQALAAGPAEVQPKGTSSPVISWKALTDLRCFQGHTAPVEKVVFSPDGRRILSSSMDATIRLWDVETGKELRCFKGHSARIPDVVFTSDGRRILSAGWDQTMRLWDVESGQQVKQFVFAGAPGVHVSGVMFFPDGKRFLAFASDHHALHIVDTETGKLVKEFAEHPDHVSGLTLSPDGRRVLEGNWDHTMRLWDVESGKLLREFKDHPGSVYGVAFSPDGRRALSSGAEGTTFSLWDLESAQEIRRFEGHAKHIDWVVFSPDGRRALSCGPDQTVRLWHIETGTELRRFFGHTNRVACVAFSPDGRYAVSGGWDNTVRLWRLPR
jgi:RNA polymerase sigma factor (sigma-70 family)